MAAVEVKQLIWQDNQVMLGWRDRVALLITGTGAVRSRCVSAIGSLQALFDDDVLPRLVCYRCYLVKKCCNYLFVAGAV